VSSSQKWNFGNVRLVCILLKTLKGARVALSGFLIRRIEIARGCMVSLTKNIMAFVIYALCEDTTVQYLCYTGPTARLRIVGCDGEVRQATWCIGWVVLSEHSARSLHCACHQPGSSHPFRSTSCHPDDYGQASEVLRPYRPLEFRWGPHAGLQRWHRRSAERVETTSRSPSSNMASYNRERPRTTEPGGVVCQAQSIWPWTVAWNCGNGNAPAGASYMMIMMISTLYRYKNCKKNLEGTHKIKLTPAKNRGSLPDYWQRRPFKLHMQIVWSFRQRPNQNHRPWKLRCRHRFHPFISSL